MKSSNTKYIIKKFFEKEASEKSQFLFRKWFCLEENHEEKEKSMEELWEASPSVTTTQTIDELSKIKNMISDKVHEKA